MAAVGTTFNVFTYDAVDPYLLTDAEQMHYVLCHWLRLQQNKCTCILFEGFGLVFDNSMPFEEPFTKLCDSSTCKTKIIKQKHWHIKDEKKLFEQILYEYI